jgi:methyl-accepting chemotaxis protein
MNIWMNLKVNIKLQMMVLVAVVVLAVIVCFGLSKMKTMAADEEEMSIAVKHVDMLNDLKSDLQEISLDLMYMLILEDQAKLTAKAEDITKRKQSINEGMAAFRKYQLDPKEKELLETFRQGYEEYLVQGEKLAQMARESTGNHDARVAAVSFAVASVAPLNEKPAKAINDLVDYNVKEAAESYTKDEAAYHAALTLMIAISIVAGLLMSAIGLLIAGSISRPLKMVYDTLALVASGDLTARSPIRTREEMGMLAGEVNVMAEKLQQTMNQVVQSSMQVAAAAGQLNTTAERIATGAEEVAAQTGAVATASEEMAATSMSIAQNCHQAADGSEQANSTARAGAAVVEQTVAVMGRIASRVAASAQTVAGLGDRSDQIGEIIGTIEDIADQTNLLALNAAIEAARAGEQGRGFAVVADEVRALAERTTKATREIAEMIKAIQSETRGAVEAMQQGVNEVESGTREASKSGEALSQILVQISAVTMQVNQIATAAEEQTATTGKITGNIQQITEVVHDTSRGAHQSATAAGELAGLAEGLRTLVVQFRLS